MRSSRVSKADRSRSARGTETLQSWFYRPSRPGMTTSRLESWPTFLPAWGSRKYVRGPAGRSASRLRQYYGLYGRSVRRACERAAKPKPSPGPPHPPTRHGLPVNVCLAFSFSGATVQAPLAGKSCKSALNPVSPRKMREAQRSPQLTQNEPMPRKGNVLSCVDTRQRSLARKRDRRYDEWYPRAVPASSVKAGGIVHTGVRICLHSGIGGNGDVFG